MTNNIDDAWRALMQCAKWEYHQFVDGPLSHLLMHAVVDATGQLRGDNGSTSRASARLVLRNGAIFGVIACARRVALLDVLMAAGAALAGQRYDESAFDELDAVLASALMAAGHPGAQVALEHNATVLPRPLLTVNQIGRLALRALNIVRLERGEPALLELAASLADRFALACSFDDPAVQVYRAALEPNAAAYRDFARAVNGFALDRLAVYNFISASHGHARNRVQAMQVLPWLLPMMTAAGDGRILFEVVSIRHAIDEGLPLYGAVAVAFDVPREVVRWLGRRTLPCNWGMDVVRLRRFLALLSWVAPERRPRTASQFDVLMALGSAIAAPLGFHGEDDRPALLARYAPCMRRWLAHVTRAGLEAATVAPDFPQLSLDLADAKDFLRALFEGLQVQERLDHEAARAQVLRWCAGVEVTRLLALSREWHAVIATEIPDSTRDDANSRWLAVLAQPWQYEQITVIELTSGAQLRTEGQVMQHCVGSYDDLCRSGNIMIVSLRARSGKPVSTAELYVGDGVTRVVVGQHRAVRNAIPSAECAQALVTFVGFLNRADNRELLRRKRDFQRHQADQRRTLWGAGEGEESAFTRTAQQAALRLALGTEDSRRGCVAYG